MSTLGPTPSCGCTPTAIDPQALADAADRHFIQGGMSCGEVIVKAGCEALGIPDHGLSEAALALAGGIGLQGHVCGAISGAGLVLSLAVARAEKDRLPRMMRTWQVSGTLCQEMARRLGSAQCRDLCGLDLTQPEGLHKLAGGVKQERCAPVVRAAARLLAEELNHINRAL